MIPGRLHIYLAKNQPPVIKTIEELQKGTAREEWENIITQGWRRTEEDWTKKES